MAYCVEMAYEMGSSWDGCNGTSEWIREAHVVHATTKKELIEKKNRIKKSVEGSSTRYTNVYLSAWKAVDDYSGGI